MKSPTTDKTKFQRSRGQHQLAALVQCGQCFAKLGKKGFKRHTCIPTTIITADSEEGAVPIEFTNQTFHKMISALNDDEVGKIIRGNRTFLKLSQRFLDTYLSSNKLESASERMRSILRDLANKHL